MGSMINIADRNGIKADLENDRRDVKDLWNDALRSYKGVLGVELTPTFANVDAMREEGNKQMNAFHKWRHDGAKVDRLRSLFMENIVYIETGTRQLIVAAEPAFPPAAAIGTALTFILGACKSVSADYDVVTSFFEDMNTFLQRVSILEARLPSYKAYQACLMDVFTSLLTMCAFAQKFIKLGRFKKWVINAFQGEDGDLAGSRKGMDKALVRLESATEFAILANTENIAENQLVLQSMQVKLRENQRKQYELAESQKLMMETMLERQANVSNEIGDIKKLLLAMQDVENTHGTKGKQGEARAAINAVRAVISDIPENTLQLQLIRDAHLPGTGKWVFEEPAWKSWYRSWSTGDDITPLLLIKGPNGAGKSHLAFTIYEYIDRETKMDPSKLSSAVYFSCQESIANLKTFQSVINWTILHISDTSSTLRNQLNGLLSQDYGGMHEEDYITDLLIPLFSAAFKYHLYMVIDGIDALETKIDRDFVFDLVDKIKQEGLHIKIIATSRPHVKPPKIRELGEKNWKSDNEIVITKDKTLPDMRTIIQSRLQSTDSAFRGIRYLRDDFKTEIASRLEQSADGLLYVEQGLLYLSNLGREEPIRKLFTTAMPEHVTDWFSKLVGKCERRTPLDLAAPLESLLTWLLFSFDYLNLDGINRLLQIEANKPDLDIEDEIMDIYNVFLQIRSTGTEKSKGAEALTTSISQPAPAYKDSNTQLMFRERSMHEFFLRRQANIKSVKSAISHGHRKLFLLCCRVIEEQTSFQEDEKAPNGHKELQRYALKYCLRHWRRIHCDMHDIEENVAVYEAFINLICYRQGLAQQIETAGLDFTISKLLIFHQHAPNVDWDQVFFEGWDKWSQWLQDTSLNQYAEQMRSCLTAVALEYWTKDHTDALVPLAKAHLRNWLAAEESSKAIVAYDFARKTLAKTSMHELLCSEIGVSELEGLEDDNVTVITVDDKQATLWYEEILRLRQEAGSDLDGNSHFVTAILAKFGRSNCDSAIVEMKRAVEKSSCKADEFRYYFHMGRIYYFRRERSLEDCMRCFDLAFQLRDQASHSDVLQALVSKVSYLLIEDKLDEAFALYQEILSLDNESLVIDSVVGEYIIMSSIRCNWPALMKVFWDLSAIQRLKVALFAFGWSPPLWQGTHSALLRAAVETDEVDGLTRTYVSIVASLETVNMTPIWTPFLAQIYWTWYANIDAAKTVLTKALSTTCTTQEYPLVKVDTGFIALRNVNMMMDILFQQFQSSRDSETKAAILNEQSRSLLQRHLPQSVQINDANTIPYLLVLANMTRKVGSAQEYEKLLRQAFDIAWTNLHDAVTWNDSSNVCYLSRVIAQIPTLQREAEILNSAQLYYLGDHSMFASYCREKKFKVDAATATNFERTMVNETTNTTVQRPESLPDDQKDLYKMYQNYLEENPDGFSTYDFLRGQSDAEAKRWDAPECTCAELCAHIPSEPLAKGFSRYIYWSTWADGQLYTCIFCTDSVLCRKCYDVRIKWNKEGKPEKQPSFCCSNGQYIKSPAPGWLGIKNQCIYLEGQAPIRWEDFLLQVRMRWNEYWNEFWLG